MRLKMLTVAILVAAGLYGCDGGGGGGGSSGVDSSKTLMSLSQPEWMTLCSYIIVEQGGEGHVTDCGGGVTITTQTVSECVADSTEFATCTATVGQAEACAAALGADPCSETQPAACEAIFACIFGQG